MHTQQGDMEQGRLPETDHQLNLGKTPVLNYMIQNRKRERKWSFILRYGTSAPRVVRTVSAGGRWESTAQEARFPLQRRYESTRILQTATHPRGESAAAESHVNLTVISSDMGRDRSCTQALQIQALGCPERFLLCSNYS